MELPDSDSFRWAMVFAATACIIAAGLMMGKGTSPFERSNPVLALGGLCVFLVGILCIVGVFASIGR